LLILLSSTPSPVYKTYSNGTFIKIIRGGSLQGNNFIIQVQGPANALKFVYLVDLTKTYHDIG